MLAFGCLRSSTGRDSIGREPRSISSSTATSMCSTSSPPRELATNRSSGSTSARCWVPYLAKLTGETIDRLHAVLRHCREHCDGRPFVVHRVMGAHECDVRCRLHVCKPLSTASIRKVHFCLSGALSRAVRWEWINVNPLHAAEPPRGVQHNPHPPSAEQAAAIVTAAFAMDLGWGVLIWLAMTTGARRGELCAMRWDSLDLGRAVVAIRTSIAQQGSRTWEKDTKTHQQRRIPLDETSVALVRAFRRQCTAVMLGVSLLPGSRVFSPEPDHRSWVLPSSVTQRYARMCARLGWDMNLHELRHYSATELISGGTDVRTVAGRLGHGRGGTTTLKAYAAWVSEADQRAAGRFGDHMPALPVELDDADGATAGAEVQALQNSSPYLRIASDLRGAIISGLLGSGQHLPTVAQLMERYDVAAGTAHRAVAQLAEAGLVQVTHGRARSLPSVALPTPNHAGGRAFGVRASAEAAGDPSSGGVVRCPRPTTGAGPNRRGPRRVEGSTCAPAPARLRRVPGAGPRARPGRLGRRWK